MKTVLMINYANKECWKMRKTMLGKAIENARRYFFGVGLALLLLCVLPSLALSAEMVTNGDFNGDYAGWTLTAPNGAVTYDGADTASGTSGSMTSAPAAGKKTDASFTLEQNVSISSTSTLNSVSVWGKNISSGTPFSADITVTLHYVDNITTVVVFTGTVTANGGAWESVTNGTTLPSLTQDVNKITVDVAHATPNTNGATSTLWVDDISIDYTAGAGCTTANPNISLSAGQSIAASATASYTITLTNNDSGGGCGTTDFTVAVAAGGDTGNTASFVTPSVTNPASCVITLAEGATDSTSCTLDVTSAGTVTDGHIMNTLVEVTSGTHTTQTANVDTTIAAGGTFGCTDCHGNPPLDAGSRDSATGAFVGDHQVHVSTVAMACNDCHIDSSGYNNEHRNGNIELLADPNLYGGGYSRGATFAQSDTVTTGTCNTTQCHGTVSPQWGVDGGNGCTLCHNNGTTDGAAANAWPSSQFRYSDGVGQHSAHASLPSGYTGATVGCDECHTAIYSTSGDAGHLETPGDRAEVPLAGTLAAGGADTAGGYASPAQTCVTYCHGAGMSSNGDGTRDGLTPDWGVTSLDGTFATDCNFCHGFPPKGYGGSHEGMTNDDGTGCDGCHTHVNPVGSWGTAVFSTPADHINGTVDAAGGCNGCHDSGSGGAPVVTAASTHVDADGAGPAIAGTCTDCHNGHANGTPGVNDVEISTDVPIFTAGTYSAHAGGAIQLGGTATAGYAVSTEAEMCWSCHDANSISEWGKTWGAYDTGTVNNSNWMSATWTSANFSYKTNTMSSVHSTGNMGTTADTYTRQDMGAEAEGEISCTYCHDVHMVKKTAGAYDPVATPYLRGSWTSNVYKEDGAPGWGHTTWAQGDARGVVPRAAALVGQTGNNELGGWQIEQNNGRDDSTQSYANFGGLCNNCHTQGDLEGLATWSGHDNVVAGFSGGSETNIFWQGNRMNWANAKKGTWEYGYIIHAGADDARGVAAGKSTYVGALRNSFQWSDGIQPPAGKPQYAVMPQPSFANGAVTTLDVTGTTPQANFHNFMCSKCHNPHASRLPRLMITNCLDVQHNNWDDGATFDPSSWAASAEYGAGDLAYSPSAGNCHRYVDGSFDANDPDDGNESGWNTVTPWTRTIAK